MPPIGCRHPHAHECSRPASPSHTTAGEAVAVQSVPGVAGAFEGAGGVAAVVLTAPVLDCALIHICGVAGHGNGQKATSLSSLPRKKRKAVVASHHNAHDIGEGTAAVHAPGVSVTRRHSSTRPTLDSRAAGAHPKAMEAEGVQ